MTLAPGDSVRSPSGAYALVYQPDGNLVMYGADGKRRWDSGTFGLSAGVAAMQGDGNLVVYNAGGVAVWNSQTQGRSGAWLAVQDDGNVVLYYQGSRAIWVNGYLI